jgi:UDP-N-acetylglucosamine 2-epimerase (non-hydrolysing)
LLDILFVLGTRPEAIKMAPLIGRLRRHHPALRPRVCSTGQHRELLDEALRVFGVVPDHDLGAMRPGQTVAACASRILDGLDGVIRERRPDLVVVQGDTTSTLCGALAAFWSRTPLVHVEAGLRTGDVTSPFPEEANRVLTGRLTALHFAATRAAADNLLAEGVPAARVVVTGNTGIDALLAVRDGLESGRLKPADPFERPAGRRLVLVTTHRRESEGDGRRGVAQALRRLARRPDVAVLCALHPNPRAGAALRAELRGARNVYLRPAADYVSFVDWMRRADVLLTDSGGVQEEAPSLGKPVLVLRETTERREGVAAGASRLVGCDPETIVGETERLLDDPEEYARRSAAGNPYGDGRASERIAVELERRFAPRGLAAAV